MRPLLIVASIWLFVMAGLAALPDDAFFGISILAGVLLLLCWVPISVWSLVISAQSFRRKAWPAVLVCLVLPIAVPSVAVEAMPYVSFPFRYARFQTLRASYDGQVAKLPRDGKRYAEFNWGGMSFASDGVVYDETDEVMRPYGHQSADWKNRMRSTDLTCGRDGPIGTVLPLGGHYYFTSFGCQNERHSIRR